MYENFVELNNNFGITILIVKQKVKEVLTISFRTYGLKMGEVAYDGTSQDLLLSKEKLKELFL